MSYGPERERWFAFRSERLRIFMEAWLSAHALNPVARPLWVPEVPHRPEAVPPSAATPVTAPTPATAPTPVAAIPVASAREREREEVRELPRRGKSVETLRRNLREIADALGPRDLDTLLAFAEFLKTRRAARSFAHAYQEPQAASDEESGPASAEISSESHSDTA
jgi:hypothetical protein